METTHAAVSPRAESAGAPADGPEAVRRPLRNHEPRSRTTIHGRGAVVFGLVFVAAGTFVTLCALDVIPTDDADYHVPRELVATIGALLFALPGASLVAHGVAGVIRQRRRRRSRRDHLDRPWRADHAWDPRGETRWGFAPFRRRIGSVLGLALFLLPFHWLALEVDGAWPLHAFLGVFDLVVVGIACSALLQLARALRFGRMRLRYERFPFHPGDDVTLHLTIARTRRIRALRLTLCCVEEAYESRGTGSESSQVVVAYALHEDERELLAETAGLAPGRELSVTFPVPRDAPGTDLSSRPPRYWQLQVRGDARGPDLIARFLVPIYERT